MSITPKTLARPNASNTPPQGPVTSPVVPAKVETPAAPKANTPSEKASYRAVKDQPKDEPRPGTSLKGGATLSLQHMRFSAVETRRTGEAAKVAQAQPTAVGVKEIEDPSLPNAFLKVKKYALSVNRPGVKEPQTVEVTALRGPKEQDGCTMVATFLLDPKSGAPCAVFKMGDTRLAPTLRGEDYVGVGMAGGRWDHDGVSPEKIGVGEIAEELGGGIKAFFSISDTCVPTMPHEAMEVDAYYAAVIKLGDQKIAGDGGGMEVASLMRPGVMRMDEALYAMDNGLIREGARARVAYTRALDAMGYIPQLGVYARDLPPALQKKFSDLGVTKPTDARPFVAPLPDAKGTSLDTVERSALKNLNPGNIHQIQRDATTEKTQTLLGGEATFIATQTKHITTDGSAPAGKSVPNQLFSVNFDRAKSVQFYNDPDKGPMVKMEWAERPLMAAKGLARKPGVTYPKENSDLARLDTTDLKVGITNDKGETLKPADVKGRVKATVDAWAQQQGAKSVVELGEPTYASPGQSQLKYHFYAASVDAAAAAKDTGYVPLAEAIRMCRADGQGDAATEALLLRLAAKEDFIPQLGMRASDARKLLQG